MAELSEISSRLDANNNSVAPITLLDTISTVSVGVSTASSSVSSTSLTVSNGTLHDEVFISDVVDVVKREETEYTDNVENEFGTGFGLRCSWESKWKRDWN